MEEEGMNPVRELIISIRGEPPVICDICGEDAPPDLMHPDEPPLWKCIDCVEKEERHAEIRT